jgi:hypothetical protein
MSGGPSGDSTGGSGGGYRYRPPALMPPPQHIGHHGGMGGGHGVEAQEAAHLIGMYSQRIKNRRLWERVRTIEEVFPEVSQVALGSWIMPETEREKKRLLGEVYDTQYYLESFDKIKASKTLDGR